MRRLNSQIKEDWVVFESDADEIDLRWTKNRV